MSVLLDTRRAIAAATVATATLAFAALTGHAQAQEWPQRPVRIVVPYAAGGNSDGMARVTAQRLGDAFG